MNPLIPILNIAVLGSVIGWIVYNLAPYTVPILFLLAFGMLLKWLKGLIIYRMKNRKKPSKGRAMFQDILSEIRNDNKY